MQLEAAEQVISRDTLLEKYAKGDETSVERRAPPGGARARPAEAAEKRAHWEQRFLQAQEDGFIPGGRINSAAGVQLQATLINCFVQPVGDSISETVDGKPGHLCRAAGGGRDHAPRRRRRLRLLRHPPQGRRGERHRARARAARCPTCACSTSPARRSNRPARAAARRWACCAATTRTSRTSSTPRTRATCPTSTCSSASPTPSCSAVEPTRLGARAQAAGASLARTDGYGSTARCARATCGSRSCGPPTTTPSPGCCSSTASTATTTCRTARRSRPPIPAPSSRCRPTAAAAWASINLTPFVREPFSRAGALRFRAVRQGRRDRRCACSTTCSTPPSGRSRQQHKEATRQAPHRAGLHRAGRRAHHAGPALRHRARRAHGGAHLGSDARRGLRCLGGAGAGEGRVSAVQCRPLPRGPRFAVAPARGLKSEIRRSTACATATCCRSRPPARSRSPSPTTPRTASSRRSPGPTAQEAHARRHDEELRRGGPRLAALQGSAAATSTQLPPYFVTALEISAARHMRMVAAVAPFMDTAISKTVNVPEDYPYADFKDLYLEAWKSGLKGITTYRPNKVLGSVLSVRLRPKPPGFRAGRLQPPHHASRACPQPALSSLRWPGRPELAAGNPSWTYMVEHPSAQLRGVRRPRGERRRRTPSRCG